MRRVDSSLNYRVASFVRVPRLARVLFSTIEETVLNVAHEPIDVYHTEQRVNDARRARPVWTSDRLAGRPVRISSVRAEVFTLLEPELLTLLRQVVNRA